MKRIAEKESVSDPNMAGDDNDNPEGIWGNGCTEYIVSRILLTFPKLSAGPKFEKAFRTEANRLVYSLLYFSLKRLE